MGSPSIKPSAPTPDLEQVFARLEATTLGLALVVDEPICSEAARLFLDSFDRQVAEISSRESEKGQD